MSTVMHIFVAAKKRAPMQSLTSVDAAANEGLRGDRYIESKHRPSADYQVTLIELENIEAFTRATGLALFPEMPRRNIVTCGVRLNDLCGRRFVVGKAVFEGLELCEPCGLFAQSTYREVLKFFVRRGGLRARIISSGQIRIGDSVVPMLSPE
jgi:MOSC domain-containing protein YiiM